MQAAGKNYSSRGVEAVGRERVISPSAEHDEALCGTCSWTKDNAKARVFDALGWACERDRNCRLARVGHADGFLGWVGHLRGMGGMNERRRGGTENGGMEE